MSFRIDTTCRFLINHSSGTEQLVITSPEGRTEAIPLAISFIQNTSSIIPVTVRSDFTVEPWSVINVTVGDQTVQKVISMYRLTIAVNQGIQRRNFIEAAKTGNKPLLDSFLGHGPIPRDDLETGILEAAKNGQTATVKSLLEGKYSSDHFLMTLMDTAAKNGHEEIVIFLLEFIKSRIGITGPYPTLLNIAIITAAQYGHKEIVALLRA